MNNKINIAVIGLGQIGNYLLNELNSKKKDIELKTGKKINIVAISAKNINKKRKFKINKKIFYKNPLNIFKIKKIDLLILNFLFLLLFFADIATILIFLPVFSSISFFLVLSSLSK